MCRLCSSGNEAEFVAEIMVHFSRPSSLTNPGVLLFPKVLVCLECGSAQFEIPEAELKSLSEGNARCTAAQRKAAS
jgi:hypothetical protein